jgi:hypothetical protein
MIKLHNILFFALLYCATINSNTSTYNSLGQTGLINIPSAEVNDEQSIFFTFKKTSYEKHGTITVTPFDWLEASYFYYRPDDLLWGGFSKGLYLDKGFNIKFSYKPEFHLAPHLAIGLDDFAGTGMFSKEYVAATYNFNNVKFTSGIGWGKFVGDSKFKNPLSFISERFDFRQAESDYFDRGGNLSTDLWFRGNATLFAGFEVDVPKVKGLRFKLESNPFDYNDFSCCGEGQSDETPILRKNESDINFGFSYKYKNFGNIDFAYIKGNTWNISWSFGFSSKKPLRKKEKFNPMIENKNYDRDKKNEFYLDILENLNRNKLYLQTADIEEKKLSITIDSEEHFNPIIYSSRAAYIANDVSKLNEINFETISVGQIIRGAQINSITYKEEDLDLYERYPDVIIKRNSNIDPVNPNAYKVHEFKPKVNFPIFINNLAPDIRTHIGSPQRFMYAGIGIKLSSEIQLNREFAIYSTVAKSLEDNFDKKASEPASGMELVRTQIVDYLQQTSKDFYIRNLELERIWSPYKSIYAKTSIGLLEQMYGGFASEVMYKPFDSNFAFSIEYNKVKKRAFDGKFDFLEYETYTQHFNVAYYHPSTNILAKWSYGKYLAQDKGYTLDLSRRMPSGWSAGIFFSITNVSAEEFGEGSFDKGFYFTFPLDIFSTGYSKNINGFRLRTMTRDGGQKLELGNRLIDSFYGSTRTEINENWKNYLD